MKQLASILALIVLSCGSVALADSSCGSGDGYSSALCSYRHGDWQAAASGFRQLVERNEPNPETMKAFYFLARTEMKLKRWDEAQTLLIRIYTLDPPFYRAWNCDFLLGVAREGAGKG